MHPCLIRLSTAAALFAGALTAATTPPAAAAPVAYTFAGQVSDDTAGRGYTHFSGSFSFDSATPDGIADPSTGAYAHSGAPWGLTLQFDALAPFAVQSAFNVLVSNGLGGQDAWGLLAEDADHSISLSLTQLAGTLFASDALPLAPLTLAMFDIATLRWDSADGSLQGVLSSLSCTAGCTGLGGGGGGGGGDTPPAVPEPGTLPLMAVALALLARQLRRSTTQARQL